MYPVSIILPVYNGIKYLDECIKSVLNQTFSDFEFLIVDDCSDDSSWSYLKCTNDNRIKLFRNEKNQGLFFNLNFLIQQSGSSLIKLWSQDDIMYPNCIEEIVKFHHVHPGIGFSYTNKHYIDAEGDVIVNKKIDNTPSVISTELHTRIAFITGSIAGNIANVTLTRAAVDKVGLFNTSMKISGDFDMWVRIAEYFEIGFIKAQLIKLRIHKGQLSNQEQYFIYHIKEDIKVYQYLFSYIPTEQIKEGKTLLRNRKLVFYYTLMIKAALKGKFRIAGQFLNAIAKFDNILILTWFFVKHKVFRIKPVFVK